MYTFVIYTCIILYVLSFDLMPPHVIIHTSCIICVIYGCSQIPCTFCSPNSGAGSQYPDVQCVCELCSFLYETVVSPCMWQDTRFVQYGMLTLICGLFSFSNAMFLYHVSCITTSLVTEQISYVKESDVLILTHLLYVLIPIHLLYVLILTLLLYVLILTLLLYVLILTHLLYVLILTLLLYVLILILLLYVLILTHLLYVLILIHLLYVLILILLLYVLILILLLYVLILTLLLYVLILTLLLYVLSLILLFMS